MTNIINFSKNLETQDIFFGDKILNSHKKIDLWDNPNKITKKTKKLTTQLYKTNEDINKLNHEIHKLEPKIKELESIKDKRTALKNRIRQIDSDGNSFRITKFFKKLILKIQITVSKNFTDLPTLNQECQELKNKLINNTISKNSAIYDLEKVQMDIDTAIQETAGQVKKDMTRGLGLEINGRLYRTNPEHHDEITNEAIEHLRLISAKNNNTPMCRYVLLGLSTQILMGALNEVVRQQLGDDKSQVDNRTLSFKRRSEIMREKNQNMDQYKICIKEKDGIIHVSFQEQYLLEKQDKVIRKFDAAIHIELDGAGKIVHAEANVKEKKIVSFNDDAFQTFPYSEDEELIGEEIPEKSIGEEIPENSMEEDCSEDVELIGEEIPKKSILKHQMGEIIHLNLDPLTGRRKELSEKELQAYANIAAYPDSAQRPISRKARKVLNDKGVKCIQTKLNKNHSITIRDEQDKRNLEQTYHTNSKTKEQMVIHRQYTNIKSWDTEVELPKDIVLL